jgi:hypothetical protein
VHLTFCNSEIVLCLVAEAPQAGPRQAGELP